MGVYRYVNVTPSSLTSLFSFREHSIDLGFTFTTNEELVRQPDPIAVYIFELDEADSGGVDNGFKPLNTLCMDANNHLPL